MEKLTNQKGQGASGGWRGAGGGWLVAIALLLGLPAFAAVELPSTPYTRAWLRSTTADGALNSLGVNTNGLDTNVVTMSVETLTATAQVVGTLQVRTNAWVTNSLKAASLWVTGNVTNGGVFYG